MKSLRVVHVTSVQMSLVHLLKDQLEAMNDAGFEVVTASSPGNELGHDWPFRHVDVLIPRRPSPARDLYALIQLFRLFRKERFDLVHTHGPKAGLLARLAAWAARVPTIVHTVHGYHFHERQRIYARKPLIWLERLASSLTDLTLFQSREDLRDSRTHRICSVGKTAYIGNGIDLRRFDPDTNPVNHPAIEKLLERSPEARIVGFVGRLSHPRKGFLHFVEACRRGRQRNRDLFPLIVGKADPGLLDAEIGDLLRGAFGEDGYVHLDWLPNSDLPGVYSVMDLLVLPSLFEGVPRVLMEGAAMGVPLIASDVRGNREVIDHGKTGYLYRFGDVDELTRLILELLNDPHAAEEVKKTALADSTRFDQELVFSRVLKAYEAVLEIGSAS